MQKTKSLRSPTHCAVRPAKSSHSDLPISYVHGAGSELFQKIEQALTGKHIGDEVAVILAPADHFGEHNPRLTFVDEVDNVPANRHPGAQVEAENGEVLTLVVRKIKSGKLTVDANHALAGQAVRFDITFNTSAAPRQKKSAGRPVDAGPLPLELSINRRARNDDLRVARP